MSPNGTPIPRPQAEEDHALQARKLTGARQCYYTITLAVYDREGGQILRLRQTTSLEKDGTSLVTHDHDFQPHERESQNELFDMIAAHLRQTGRKI